ncbi:MAG TPA: DUF2946 family protein [Rhodocyclaceae bacterium]|nr:DUF2946 family protein [Rhodocyclaceae bacterium]
MRWPNVPACYGWLSLDRRGRWRLQGEPVTHQGFIEFINRQYGCDDAGNWFLQNGPQRVFVRLERAPWIIHRLGDGNLQTHTGQAVATPHAVYMDEDGALWIAFEEGVGFLDDRDLAPALEEIHDASGQPPEDNALIAFLENDTLVANADLYWRKLPVTKEKRAAMAARFGFNPDPEPGSSSGGKKLSPG